MDRSLAGGDTRVNIYSVVECIAVSVALRCEEEHRLSLHHVLSHLRSDRNGVEGHARIIFRELWYGYILGISVPLLGIFVDKVWDHLVIESSHAFVADMDVFAGERLVVALHDFIGQVFADEISEFFAIHIFILMAISDDAFVVDSEVIRFIVVREQQRDRFAILFDFIILTEMFV